MNFDAGADEVMVDGVERQGSLSIDSGNGTGDGPAGNTVRLLNIHVGGGLGGTNLAGEDTSFLAGAVTVGGGLTVRNGLGRGTVWGDYTTDLWVGGVFSVAGGAGNDKVDLWGAAARLRRRAGVLQWHGPGRQQLPGPPVRRPGGGRRRAGDQRLRVGHQRPGRSESDRRRGGRDPER